MSAKRDDEERGEPAQLPSSTDWGLRFRRGEPEAVEIVRERVGRILAYKGLRFGHREREDLQQEIVAELWQSVNRPGFDFTAGFWGFVEIVSARRVIDWLRARREQVELDESMPSSGKGPLGSTLERERAEMVRQALAELDPDCRDLILHRLRDDLSYAEIAEKTGKSEGALRIQMYRCVKKAGEILEELAPGWRKYEPPDR